MLLASFQAIPLPFATLAALLGFTLLPHSATPYPIPSFPRALEITTSHETNRGDAAPDPVGPARTKGACLERAVNIHGSGAAGH